MKITITIVGIVLVILSILWVSIDNFCVETPGIKFVLSKDNYEYNIGKAVQSDNPGQEIKESWIIDLIQEKEIDTLVVVDASDNFKKMVVEASEKSFRKPKIEFEEESEEG